ncbi:hypothetical protein [Bacillus sp. E(2018)]|uniref:hypothetical protein n=1 Tax=Bacillus sp. E(2018) TaxID=2502239 RepID=UPI0010F7CC00|nr:hypothetical protein [Bacillus sp. E(2018)]
MKKTLLYSLLGLCIIAAGVGGYVYYIINVKTYDTADKKVSEITKKEYDIDLPSVTPASGKDDAPVSEDASPDNNDSNQATEHSASSENESGKTASGTDPKKSKVSGASNSNSHSQSPSKKVTVQQIKNAYRPAFESLQVQASGRLNSLVGHAESEYQTKKANGEKIRYGYFVAKYKSAGENLEGNTDQAFNTIYSALQRDLKRNGFQSQSASEFKKQYENEKGALRDSLLSKVKDRL